MKWDGLLEMLGPEAVFESSILQAGDVDAVDIGRQLSRWVKTGRLVQLRRGLYMLGARYRKTIPHPFLLANRIRQASYVSLQSALEHYGLIPEYVPVVTSITTRRPCRFSTPAGEFTFRHVRTPLFFDYRRMKLGDGQSAFVATPEKALLDLLYLTPESDDRAYLAELRIQNAGALDMNRLAQVAERMESRKVARAAKRLARVIAEAG
ncbi:MAG: hypothetical protein V1873_03985 [Verrucomicrobiota bacterium]